VVLAPSAGAFGLSAAIDHDYDNDSPGDTLPETGLLADYSIAGISPWKGGRT